MEGVEAAGCPQAALVRPWRQIWAAAAAVAGGPFQRAPSWAEAGAVAAEGPSSKEPF